MMSLTGCAKKIIMSYLIVLSIIILATVIQFSLLNKSGSSFSSKMNFNFTVQHCDAKNVTALYDFEQSARLIMSDDSTYSIDFYRKNPFKHTFNQEFEHSLELINILNEHGCNILASSVSKKLEFFGVNDQLIFLVFAIILACIFYFLSSKSTGKLYDILHKKVPVPDKKYVLLFFFIGGCSSLLAMITNIVVHYFGLVSSVHTSSSMFTDFTFSVLLTVILIGPFAEELIFRRLGYQIWMSETKNAKVLGALIISSLFALFHSGILIGLSFNVFMFSISYIASLMLCFAYVKGGLSASVAFHVAFNLTSLCVYYLYQQLVL
jgi:hypothetical protein